MKPALFVVAAALLCAWQHGSHAAGLRSEYTDLDLAQCTSISSDEVGGTSVCPGLRGYPVVLAEGDLRQSVSYGVGALDEKAMSQSFSPFNHVGKKIEWLVDATNPDDLQPVATILRWFIAGEDGVDKYQVLVVTQLKSGATCQIARIDALAVKDANARALSGASAVRVATEPLDGSLDLGLDALRGTWILFCDVGEDFVELLERSGRIPDLHRPCLVNMAATSASLANSPRRASAKASSRSVRSSSLSL